MLVEALKREREAVIVWIKPKQARWRWGLYSYHNCKNEKSPNKLQHHMASFKSLQLQQKPETKFDINPSCYLLQ